MFDDPVELALMEKLQELDCWEEVTAAVQYHIEHGRFSPGYDLGSAALALMVVLHPQELLDQIDLMEP